MKIKYTHANLITPYRILENGTLLIEDGRISGIEAGPVDAESFQEVNCEGLYLAPGFIDQHTHGGGGHDYMDGTVEAYLGGARVQAEHGTTLFYPTLTTGSKADFDNTVKVFKEAGKMNKNGATMGGLHLEGPFFAYAMKGAQDPRFLRNPTKEEYLPILESGVISRWSVAPELPGALELGRELRDRGIVASMGHTDGIYEDLLEAFENGYTHMTHFYSAMSTIRRIDAYRYSGAVELGYIMDEITVEIIADGIHLPESILRLIFRSKPHDKISLITDSMRAAGMPEGESILGSLNDGMKVIVEDGIAKLMDRSAFAGSVATTDRLIRTVMQKADIPLWDAVRMLTANPAKVMGIDRTKGTLAIGKDADLVLFDENINVKKTIIGGFTVYQA